MPIDHDLMRESPADEVDQARDPAVPSPPESVSCKAGHENIAGTRNCKTCGLWLPRNPAAMTSGLRVDTALIPGYDRLHAEVARFLGAALADEPADIPERRRSLIEYRARLHRLIVVLDTTLAHKGLTDKRGKLRTQWLASFSTLIDKARALDALLGLRRTVDDDILNCTASQWAARQQPVEGGSHGKHASSKGEVLESASGIVADVPGDA